MDTNPTADTPEAPDLPRRDGGSIIELVSEKLSAVQMVANAMAAPREMRRCD